LSCLLLELIEKLLYHFHCDGSEGQRQDPGQPRRVGQGDKVERRAGELRRAQRKPQKGHEHC